MRRSNENTTHETDHDARRAHVINATQHAVSVSRTIRLSGSPCPTTAIDRHAVVSRASLAVGREMRRVANAARNVIVDPRRIGTDADVMNDSNRATARRDRNATTARATGNGDTRRQIANDARRPETRNGSNVAD